MRSALIGAPKQLPSALSTQQLDPDRCTVEAAAMVAAPMVMVSYLKICTSASLEDRVLSRRRVQPHQHLAQSPRCSRLSGRLLLPHFGLRASQRHRPLASRHQPGLLAVRRAWRLILLEACRCILSSSILVLLSCLRQLSCLECPRQGHHGHRNGRRYRQCRCQYQCLLKVSQRDTLPTR